MSLKEAFIARALAKEEPFSQLCNEFKITRKSGYHLLNRYLKEGQNGLIPASKKPLNSPSRTAEEIENRIFEVREKFPTWGARKIIKFLNNKGFVNLPSASTVTEILKRNGFISITESLKRKKFIRFERENPNDLWQMDFKGKFQLLTKETCYPLTMVDDYSRYSLKIQACKNEQCLPVKKQLIHAFEKYGLPEQINVDNGKPWGDSKLITYTALAVWMMQMGVRVTHSRPRHPQTNGKCERFHRTLKNDLILRYPMKTFHHAQKLFDEWRKHYNEERPHEAIDMEVPATRYTASPRSMPSKLPTIEYDHNAELRKVRGNGHISYKSKDFLVGMGFKDQYIEIKHNYNEKLIDIYFGKFKIYTYDF